MIRKSADECCSANPFIFNKNIKNYAENKVFYTFLYTIY